MQALARRMVAPDRTSRVVSPDEVGVAEFVDRYLFEMRPALKVDVLRMLRFVEQLAPFRCGLLSRFTDLDPADQDRVLSALRGGGIDQLRAGFQAMKGLVMMGYYRDPRTFPILGYRGPFVAASEEQAPVIVRGRDLSGDVHDDADAIVVGTGAGGGMALRSARAGLKVIAVEEGGHHTPHDSRSAKRRCCRCSFRRRARA